MAEEVLLFGAWGSPLSRRIDVALKLKGVQYQYINEDLANKSDSLLKYNPVHKKVPVLVHNGKPVAESLVILEYIDETWQGYPLLPKDPYDRTHARFWTKFIDELCSPGIFKAIKAKGEEREKAVEEASEHLKLLEKELGEKRFFEGESIGMVDIVAGLLGFWLGIYEEASGAELFPREKFQTFSNWTNEFASNSVVKESLPPREKLVAFFRNRFGNDNASK